MRYLKIFFFIIISFLSLSFIGGNTLTPIDNKLLANKSYLLGLCKVWGALKYYSPYISNSKIDWDSVLVAQISNCSVIFDKTQANSNYNTLINNYTSKNVLRKNTKINNVERVNWISDTALFTAHTAIEIKKLTRNKTNFNNQYCTYVRGVGNFDFSKENPYAEMNFPAVEYRLLAFFRLWNVINYFYPHLEIIDSDWNTVLEEHFECFISCSNRNEYLECINNVLVLIDDSHFIRVKDFGVREYFPKFKLNYVKDTTYVVYPDTSQQIFVGDIIYKIDGINTECIRKELYSSIGGGNMSVKDYYANFFLVYKDTCVVDLTIIRNQDTIVVQYNLTNKNKINISQNPKPLYIKTDSQYTYINLSTINNYDVLDSIIGENINTPNLIFDMRYPLQVNLFQVMTFFTKRSKSFVKYLMPDYKHLGAFKFSKDDYFPIRTKNKLKFTGNLIVIVDRRTQSHSEFFTMALQTYEKCIVFGSETAGADGNISVLILPGNVRTVFTGIGIFYPDGTSTQRKGVKIDYYYRPSFKEDVKNENAVLEKIVNVINKNFDYKK